MPSLSAPQSIFLNDLNTKFRAYVGGFGSGKTFVGCLDLGIFAGRYPKTVQGYFAPTYPAIRDIFYPTFDEAAFMLGFRTRIQTSNKEVALYKGSIYYGTIICRSMDNPNSIIGFKIARALVDEIDTLTKDKAQLAWNKIVARLRLVIDGVENGIGVTTTPEGFLFVYHKFKKDPTARYSMVQASTYENIEYLPPDYIESLLETYPAELVEAYIRGQFVNLTSGTVYSGYNRQQHRSNETIQPKEMLSIGMDFNVTNMSAVVYVKRRISDKDKRLAWHAVDELKGVYDTPNMIRIIKERFAQHHIRVYPDASGDSRKSVDASKSDISLLRQAGFEVRVNARNPFVRDRIIATNQAFARGLLYINDNKCPEFAGCLEQLTYDKNGEPDKSSGLDHLPDAGTYPIAHEMPVVKPVSRIQVHGA